MRVASQPSIPGSDRSIRIRSGCEGSRLFHSLLAVASPSATRKPENVEVVAVHLARVSEILDEQYQRWRRTGTVIGVRNSSRNRSRIDDSSSSREHGFGRTPSHPARQRAFGLGRKRGVAGDCQDRQVPGSRILLQPSRQFEAIDTGNVQIRHNDIRPQIEGPLERLKTIVSLLNAKASTAQPFGVHTPPVTVVLHKQHGQAVGGGFQSSSPPPVYQPAPIVRI